MEMQKVQQEWTKTYGKKENWWNIKRTSNGVMETIAQETIYNERKSVEHEGQLLENGECPREKWRNTNVKWSEPYGKWRTNRESGEHKGKSLKSQ